MPIRQPLNLSVLQRLTVAFFSSNGLKESFKSWASCETWAKDGCVQKREKGSRKQKGSYAGEQKKKKKKKEIGRAHV